MSLLRKKKFPVRVIPLITTSTYDIGKFAFKSSIPVSFLKVFMVSLISCAYVVTTYLRNHPHPGEFFIR